MLCLCSHLKPDLELIPNNERVVCHLDTSITKGRDVILICEFKAAVGLLTLTMGFGLLFNQISIPS